MSQPVRASVIINNFNYAGFLSKAIDSALNQTYSPLEVIVVDDGSTDDSRSVIAGFGSQIIPVFKQNGGQGSAFNAGFDCSRGEVVIFLDADDLLLADTVERVVAEFQKKPSVAKVQYRLETISADGKREGSFIPAWGRSMPGGDLRPKVLAFPDDIPWQPTSGNAFAASVLHQIFPVPEESYRICADYYLSNLTPLYGEVVSLEAVGGLYRIHGTNQHHNWDYNLEQTRQIITRTYHTHQYLKTAADSLGLAFPDDPARVLSVTFLAHRLVSLKLEPQHHPIPENRMVLFVRGIRAAFGRFDLPWTIRCLYAAWFLGVLCAPPSMVRWLAQKFFHPGSRGRLYALASLARDGILWTGFRSAITALKTRKARTASLTDKQ